MKRSFLLNKVVLSTLLVAVTLSGATAHSECSGNKYYKRENIKLEELINIDYEDLLNFDLRVTSASKKPEKYSGVASAIYVLTNEQIRRSGANHIGDVLRLVPGLNVAQINNNQWAISSRGFNQRFSNKLLVLVDNQVVFTPAFNGVFWEQLGLVLEDIDRIEVIKGPGATLWGSNAVNGVINIITCGSKGTQGGFVSGGGGKEEQFFATTRYGDKLGKDSYYRIYGSHRTRDDNRLLTGEVADDDFSVSHGGFRIDSQLSKTDSLAVKVDGFYHNGGTPVTTPSLEPPFVDTETFSGRRKQYGGNFLTRWNRKYSDTSELQAQLNYIFERQEGGVFPLHRHTLHTDVQHRFSPHKRHDVIYGFETRFYFDNLEGNFADDFVPERRSTDLYTWFIHDEISLIEDKLKLIVGSKFEKSPHTGFEFMPNVRTAWTPNKNHTLWMAASRAVSNPSRGFEDLITPVAAFPEEESGLTGLVTLFGNRGLKAEELMAYELGYRTQVSGNTTFDVALFYNDYDEIVSAEPGEAFVGSVRDQVGPALIIPVTFRNELAATSYGAEMSAEYHPNKWLTFIGAYSFIRIDVDQGSSLDESEVAFIEGASAQHQASLRSSVDLPMDIEFDPILRYVDRLSALDVDDYIELDVRLAMQVSKDVEISVVGKNLLHGEHKEFEGRILNPPPTEIQRSVYGKISWFF